MTKLEIGDKAPAIGLKDQDGEMVRLSSFKGRKVLVFFYPKANTPGCTCWPSLTRPVCPST